MLTQLNEHSPFNLYPLLFASILSIFIACNLGCQTIPFSSKIEEQIILQVDWGYIGPIEVFFGQENGVRPDTIENSYVFNVPSSGVLYSSHQLSMMGQSYQVWLRNTFNGESVKVYESNSKEQNLYFSAHCFEELLLARLDNKETKVVPGNQIVRFWLDSVQNEKRCLFLKYENSDLEN